MNLRNAEVQDAGALADLFEQLGYTCQPSEIIERMKELVDHAPTEIFIAEDNQVVVGAIVLNIILPVHEAGKWGVVSALVINESHRREGIGAALLAHAELRAKKIGCTQIELSSSESRKEAHAFYEKNGFAEVRKRFVRLLAA